MNALPYQFNQTALLEGDLKQVGGELYETGRIQGSEDAIYGGRGNRGTSNNDEIHDITESANTPPNSLDCELTNYNIRNLQTALTPATLSNITQIDISRALGFYPSFNVAPTNTSLIIYITNEKPNDVTTKYIFEKLKFGMIPEWAKPSSNEEGLRPSSNEEGLRPSSNEEGTRSPPPRGSDNPSQKHELHSNKHELHSNKHEIHSKKHGFQPIVASILLSDNPSHTSPQTKQIQQLQSKFFNCRRETLARDKSVWTNSRRRQRCVVPVQGYFEWLKTGSHKVPHFVYCSTAPIYYLAGLFAHNVNFKDLTNVNDEYLSSFTIVTGPALKTEDGDMSWLHSRKPMRILPGTKAWKQWLDPNLEWKDDLLEDVLVCEVHDAYLDIEGYPVSKDVGNLKNQGEYLIKREKIDQKSIALFFGGRKREEEVEREAKDEEESKVKDEMTEVSKESTKNHSDPIKKEDDYIKKEPGIVDFQNLHDKKEVDSFEIEPAPNESESDFKTGHIGSKRSTNLQTPALKRQKPIPTRTGLSYRSSKKELLKKQKKQEGIALFFKPVK